VGDMVVVRIEEKVHNGMSFLLACVKSVAGEELQVHWFTPSYERSLGKRWAPLLEPVTYAPYIRGISAANVVDVAVVWDTSKKRRFTAKQGGFLTQACLKTIQASIGLPAGSND
jgi:hypothetical protein